MFKGSIPGYWLANHVPPRSLLCSKRRMSVIPYHRLIVHPRAMPENPVPIQANWLYVIFSAMSICEMKSGVQCPEYWRKVVDSWPPCIN